MAPPPKVATPRRVNGTTPNIMNGHQDLFGSDPFHPASNTSRPFDVSFQMFYYLFNYFFIYTQQNPSLSPTLIMQTQNAQ